MKNSIKVLLGVCAIAVATFFASCVKDRIDPPPSAKDFDPGMPAGVTYIKIADLKNRLNPSATGGLAITDDVCIVGYVVANDIAGNFYKQIVLQDSTGGIPLLIEKNGLAGEYPVGRKVYVKCKDLTLSAYRSYVQLGFKMDAANSLVGIPLASINKHIVKANIDMAGAQPRKLTIAELSNPDLPSAKRWLGCLVQIDSVQFLSDQVGLKYWEAGNTGKDPNVEDCGGNSIIVRTSEYADFANAPTPGGKGTIIAVYSRYLSDAQLAIRNLDDAKLTGTRCGDFATNPLVTIKSLRDMYAAGDSLNEATSKIRGVVISDRSSGNFQTKNCIIQDGSGGIIIRFNADHSYNLGDEIEINTTNAAVKPFANTLQVYGSVSQSARLNTGVSVTPQVVTLQQINSDMASYESELVRVSNVTFPTGTYSGSKIVSDGSGSNITLYTASGATYSGTTMPTTPKTVTCIPGNYFATKQITLRNIADVQ
ncbi:MAG: hypothetical protein RL660_2087 [Bacteroidota bacterium]|jgi:hypothetical protein